VLCGALALSGVVWKAWDMFSPAHRPMLQGWNDSFYYYWLPAVVIHHNLDFSDQLAHAGTVTPQARVDGLAQPRTATGLLPNKYPPGWALGSLPFFLVAHAFARANATGFEPAYLIAVWFGQLFYAVGGLWLAAKLVRRLVPDAPAGAVVLTVWLASPLLYYQSARLSLSHSQLFVLAVAIFWLSMRLHDGDLRPRVWLALGFSSALLVVTRNIDVVYLAFPAVVLTRVAWTWRRTAWLATGAVVPVAVQLAAWKILFGSWVAYSYGDERFDFAQLHLSDVLFSPRHGLFYWHPILLVGIAAIAVASWRLRLARPWLVSFALITVLNAAWPCWWFASSFGNRGFEVAIFFAMVGVAFLVNAVRARVEWRRVVIVGLTAAAVWNILLFSVFLTRRIPQETAVTYRDAAHALLTWARPPSSPSDVAGTKAASSGGS
jgi:hypothetical protein